MIHGENVYRQTGARVGHSAPLPVGVGGCQHAGAGMVFRINSTGTPVTEPLFI